MKIVIADEESIPEWLYPGSFWDIETPASDALQTDLDEADFFRLWTALGKTEPAEKALVAQFFSAVAIPHSAPTYVESLNPELLKELLAVPTHERWRVAEKWEASGGKRPNKETLAATKKLLNSLCELAARATAAGTFLVLIPDGFGE